MPKIVLEIQAKGNQNTKRLISRIVRNNISPIKLKIRYKGDFNGPEVGVLAQFESYEFKSIDEFQEKHGDRILNTIRSKNIQSPIPNLIPLYMVSLIDEQVFHERF
jgi:hypothetical protein